MNEWWGYQHENGGIQVKRYFGIKDIQEANESPFVRRTFPKFLAKDRNDALSKIKATYFSDEKISND